MVLVPVFNCFYSMRQTVESPQSQTAHICTVLISEFPSKTLDSLLYPGSVPRAFGLC